MNDTIIAASQLKLLIERIERLEADKSNILDDIKDVYKEAQSNGFDILTIKQIIKIRKMEANKLAEKEALLELYRDALGI